MERKMPQFAGIKFYTPHKKSIMLKFSKVILNYKFVYHRKKRDFIVYVIGCVSVELLTS